MKCGEILQITVHCSHVQWILFIKKSSLSVSIFFLFNVSDKSEGKFEKMARSSLGDMTVVNQIADDYRMLQFISIICKPTPFLLRCFSSYFVDKRK